MGSVGHADEGGCSEGDKREVDEKGNCQRLEEPPGRRSAIDYGYGCCGVGLLAVVVMMMMMMVLVMVGGIRRI